VGFHPGFRDGEANAGAFGARFGLEKLIEYLGEIFLVDAASLIFYAAMDFVFIQVELDINVAGV
jgi:hypothetical protein